MYTPYPLTTSEPNRLQGSGHNQLSGACDPLHGRQHDDRNE